MPEVVRQIIAVVFQHVEGLVLDLPASPGAGRSLHHVVGRHRQAGHEGAIVGDLSLSIGEGDTDPVCLNYPKSCVTSATDSSKSTWYFAEEAVGVSHLPTLYHSLVKEGYAADCRTKDTDCG